jgi:hypothetical protein
MQRLREILETDVLDIPQIGDVLSEFFLERLEEALGVKFDPHKFDDKTP